ncbi:DUF305 domain-containing protein [Nocardia sp. CWNU-33]|uniref:DUF305 domain-containing protein n=1 Tax=Nocardia sp. CWNU-33 TaxID=3392117 RepID=UPI00398EDCA2
MSQTAEIAQLRAWRQLLDPPLTTTAPMWWMGRDRSNHDGPSTTSDHPMGVAHSMGGNQGPAGHGPTTARHGSITEITRLSGQHGADADVFFLQLMIRHHGGGVDMAQTAFNTGSAAAVTSQAVAIASQPAKMLSYNMIRTYRVLSFGTCL